jgi:hypothetical protein
MSFYDDVLRELIVALGAALVLGNALALHRRRADAQARARAGRRSTKAKGSSRARGGRTATGELVQAPVTRSVAYLVLGLVMFVAGLAAIFTS